MNKPATPSTVVSVDLGPYAERARELIASGEYPSLDVLIQRALVLLDEEGAIHAEEDDAAMEAFADAAEAEWRAGGCETYSGDEVRAFLKAELKAGHAA